ncbi:MAG: hypothetical protein QOJ94_3291 [Sphingomonadales bacterium]|nr:hypothetical protein [Sphingomonadales bacterium]
MFGFKKRDAFYGGFLKLAIGIMDAMRAEFGANPDTISIAAFLAAWLHASSLNGGVKVEEAKRLVEHMRLAGLEVFGRTDQVSLVWSTSFELAQRVWGASTGANRALAFWIERSESIPWNITDAQFLNIAVTSQKVMIEWLRDQYPRWR